MDSLLGSSCSAKRRESSRISRSASSGANSCSIRSACAASIAAGRRRDAGAGAATARSPPRETPAIGSTGDRLSTRPTTSEISASSGSAETSFVSTTGRTAGMLVWVGEIDAEGTSGRSAGGRTTAAVKRTAPPDAVASGTSMKWRAGPSVGGASRFSSSFGAAEGRVAVSRTTSSLRVALARAAACFSSEIAIA